MNKKIFKNLIDITPSKQELINLYKHKKSDCMTLEDHRVLISLCMYVNLLGKYNHNV